MGLCASNLSAEEKEKLAKEKARSRALEKEMLKANEAEVQINKLLLLGAGESGKSTLFKQMIEIYGSGFTTEERISFRKVLWSNTIQCIKELAKQSVKLQQTHPELGSITAVAAESEALRDEFAETKVNEDDVLLDQEMADKIVLLWKDPGIQNTYEHRAKFQLLDSAEYFFDNVKNFAHGNYIPTTDDVLRCRIRTTGIVEQEFVISTTKFRMFDVGGQRNERRKWIHCFSEVTAVIFVAALSAYDQSLFEDENTNRMVEALALFHEISNSPWFKKTAMILFLNKKDLFDKKIQTVPLQDFFPSFTDYLNAAEPDADFNKVATDFISERFYQQSEHNKKIYVHVTCATDTDTMRHVFVSVKDIVIRRSLEEGGLLSTDM